MTLTEIKPSKEKVQTQNILKNAASRNFDTVIVFGFNNETQTSETTWSGSISKLELLGALEAAKQHIFKSE